MRKSKYLDNVLETINNGDKVVIFKINGDYKEDKEFVEELMKDKYGNGVYRISNVYEKLVDDIDDSKIVLFYSTEEQLYFGWGVLEDRIKDMGLVEKYITSGNYGPFLINDVVREKTKGYYGFGPVVQDEKKFDKKYYKFHYAELLKFPFTAEENKYAELIKEPPRGSFQILKVIDAEKFCNLLRTKRSSINNFKLPTSHHSLIEQIDSYDIENVHTAFLKNFLIDKNIYRLSDQPMKNFISLIVNNLTDYYKKYDKKDILNDTYEVISQARLKTESGKSIQPDLVLLGKKYRFIIENKYYSLEHSDQTFSYYNHYEKEYKKDKIKNIYVFLSLTPTEILSAEVNTNKKNIYIRIYFKDLLNKVYLANNYKNMSHRKILADYLKSFVLTANPDYNVDIEYIPYIDVDKYSRINDNDKFYTLYQAKQFYNSLREKNVPEKCGVDFEDNIKVRTTARYLLVMLYNDSNEDKKIIKEIYNKFKTNR